jgi:DNA-binding IclR family transcriptional regulator
MARREANIQSVDRAIEILERLAGRGGCASLSELADDLGLSRSTVHGLLATLKQRGLVAQETNAHYALGIKLFELGSAAVARLDLRTSAGPVLEGLVERFQETVHLVVRDGLDVIYIDKRESPRSMRIVSQVGARLPAYCTAVGKAILAFLPEEELERLLAGVVLRPWSDNTLTDPEILKLHLQGVRRNGYALDNEEIFEGLRCVGAPIRDHTQQVIAALSVAGPSVRLGAERIEEIIPAVTAAAAELSRQLGYRQPANQAGEQEARYAHRQFAGASQ